MTRELPRTLHSLSRAYQRDLAGIDYEVVVVDNGSRDPVSPASVAAADARFRVHRIDPADALPSPAAACNLGVELTRGRHVGVILDGARMVTPRAISRGMGALRTHPRAIVTALAWHLGSEHQSVSIRKGYDSRAEDQLLADIAWPSDGYRLFDIAALAGANPGGFFGSVTESCFLMLRRSLWTEVGGMDAAFDAAGGGLVNLDLFQRLISLPDSQLTVLLGEGSFHQVHGGASTKPDTDSAPWYAQYERLRGQPYSPPDVQPAYFGALGESARPWLLGPRVAPLSEP